MCIIIFCDRPSEGEFEGVGSALLNSKPPCSSFQMLSKVGLHSPMMAADFYLQSHGGLLILSTSELSESLSFKFVCSSVICAAYVSKISLLPLHKYFVL